MAAVRVRPVYVVAFSALFALAVALFVISLGDDEPAPSNAAFSPTPTPSPTSQTFDNSEPCPPYEDAELPGPAGCVSWAEDDFDGDGTDDRFLVFAELRPDRTPRGWFAAVETRSRLSEPVKIPRGNGLPSVYPRVFGVADANGDGRPEVFVKLSAILYHVGGQQILGLFMVEGGGVVQADLKGRPLIFPIGGISGYGDGLRCSERDGEPLLLLRHIRRVGVPPEKYEWTERAYAWEGTSLRLLDETQGDVPIEALLSDPRVQPYYELRCGDIQVV